MATGANLEIDSTGLLDSLADAVVVADTTGTIVFVNRSAENLLRAARDTLIGSSLGAIVPERLRSQHDRGFARFVRTRERRILGGPPLRLPVLCADGTEVEIDLALSSHAVGEEVVFVAALRDLSDVLELERQRAIARYLSASREITSRLALGVEAASVEEAAPILLEALGAGVRWDGGAVWVPRPSGLVAIAAWSADDDDIGRRMSEGFTFGRGEGLPGAVYAAGDAEWIETVGDDHRFLRRPQAEVVGVTSCFAFPLIVAGDVVGVVEMYSRSSQPPEPELLAVLQAAGIEIGRYIERAQSRRHLIEMAEALQASLLPPHPPAVPGLDIAVRYRAAAGLGQVGGDFFDVFPLPDGEWVVLIGDVSGRGPRAAALTALARYTLRAASVGAASPSAALRILNDVVRQELAAAPEDDERFLTVAYLTIAPAEEGLRVTVACGGHPLPIARRADGSVEDVPCDGELIGAFDAHESTDRSLELRHGDVIVLVTDGVLEARRNGDEFGDDRLHEVVRVHGGGTATHLADAIEAAVLDHLGGSGQDDVAIVVLRLPQVESSDTTTVDTKIGEVL